MVDITSYPAAFGTVNNPVDAPACNCILSFGGAYYQYRDVVSHNVVCYTESTLTVL